MQRDPRRPFMSYEGRTWSWDAFHDAMLRTAHVLAARGITLGDRVAVMARNNRGHPLMLFALARLGAIMVPVNPEFGVSEARYVLDHAGVAAVACSSETLAVARAASSGITPAPWFLLLDGAAEGVPALEDLIAAAPDAALPRTQAPMTPASSFIRRARPDFPRARCTASAVSSRAARLSCSACMSSRRAHHDRAAAFPHQRAFYSVAGTLAAGACMVIVPRFAASTFWQTAADSSATEVNIIDAIGTILMNRPRSEFRPAHRITKIYGARQAVVETFRNEFHVPHLIGGYGMTRYPGSRAIRSRARRNRAAWGRSAVTGSRPPLGRMPGRR